MMYEKKQAASHICKSDNMKRMGAGRNSGKDALGETLTHRQNLIIQARVMKMS